MTWKNLLSLVQTDLKSNEPQMTDKQTLIRMIRAGKGDEQADLVLKNISLLDVISGTITKTDIGIVNDRIIGTHASYSGKIEMDCTGKFAVPGIYRHPFTY